MAATPSHSSRDGFQWTEATGIQRGLPTLGAIKPTTSVRNLDAVHDVIVIGAGYAGLTTARDLTTAGHHVLLVEARDRIGGRTWSSNIDGYAYEMGGTWVHWHQPLVWRELFRYNMQNQLAVTPVSGFGVDSFTLLTPNGRSVMSHQEEEALIENAVKKFVNVDGNNGRTIIPLPHDPHSNPDVEKYDRMSFADRLAEIEDQLTPSERAALLGLLHASSGASPEDASFFEMLRWWALCNYDMHWYNELCLTYRLKAGQSTFARKFFDEAKSTGNLSYAFDTPIKSVTDLGPLVRVESRDGRVFKARRAVATVPLNVLKDIDWSPPLNSEKRQAAELGHVNQVPKVHFECANPDLRSFSGMAINKKLTMVLGDGITPAGNAHVVAFGNSLPGTHLQADEDVEGAIAGAKALVPSIDVKRVVSHNWHKDEFAKGAWEWLRPMMATKFLKGLRQRQGNVLFASGDWALGWRGFIDGAIEDGTRVAAEVSVELNASGKGQPKL